jgi:hypothetical protein
MELREHLIGPCARVVDRQVVLDDVSLIRRLILFERYTLRSIHLLEVPRMIELFGEEGLQALLEDGCLGLHCEPMSMSETLTHDEPPGFPDGAMQFRVPMMRDWEAYLDECLQTIQGQPGPAAQRRPALEEAIRGAIVRADGVGRVAEAQLARDLEVVSPLIAESISSVLARETKIVVDPSRISLEIEPVPTVPLFGEGVLIRHNLPELWPFKPYEIEKALVYGPLALGNLNLRIALMESLSGIGGCGPNDLPLFEAKLRFFLSELDPAAQEERMLRVQELAGIPEPDLRSENPVDAEALLEARKLPETRALRSWLRGVGSMSDAEVIDCFAGVTETLGQLVRSGPGKVFRIALLGGANTLSMAATGLPTSPGLDLLDAFVVERLLPEPGPYSFISRTWPSLFRQG